MNPVARTAVDHFERLRRSLYGTGAPFTVTQEHLNLLKRGCVDWFYVDEWHGAPGLSTKRPFGNSDIHDDIAEVVEGAFLNAMGEGARADYVHANSDRWERLRAEVGVALQICLSTQQFGTGTFIQETSRTWTKIND